MEKTYGVSKNPLIIVGGIVVTDILVTHLKYQKKGFLGNMGKIVRDKILDHIGGMAAPKKQTTVKNHATTYHNRSYGNLKIDMDEIPDFYFPKP